MNHAAPQSASSPEQTQASPGAHCLQDYSRVTPNVHDTCTDHQCRDLAAFFEVHAALRHYSLQCSLDPCHGSICCRANKHPSREGGHRVERVAEEIVYGEDEVTTGASNDLQQVASTARQMITRFGMSDVLGPVALGRAQGGMFLGRDIAAERDFSEETAATIDQEVSELVDVAYKRATKVLVDNRAVLDELAGMLIEQETVDAEELQELLIKRDVRIAEYV